jgi:CRISPR-associated endonuclease/helicase Cas3
LNTRDHAGILFDEISLRRAEEGSLFHLSTRMCAAHRLQVIAQIRARLKDDLPCVEISTQLIEAGVDLDFPIAFRALGPLDSIVQVAGRADREGLLTAKAGKPAGRLVVFKPADHKMPPNEHKEATGTTEVLAKMTDIQPDDLDAMGSYFEAYYGNADLGNAFLDMRKTARFRTLADEFEMISSRTQDVYVPFGEGKTLIDELYRRRQLDGGLRRRRQDRACGG